MILDGIIERYHNLKPNHRGIARMKIFSIDTETSQALPFLFQTYDGKKVILHWSNEEDITKDFIEWIEEISTSKEEIGIFAHGLHYDLPMLFFPFMKNFLNDEFKFMIDEWEVSGFMGTPIFCQLRKKISVNHFKIVNLYNTYDFFKASLEKLAKQLNLKVKKLKRPKGLGLKKFTSKDKDFVEYASQDAVVTYEIGKLIFEFHEKYDVGMSISLPQLGERIFRHKYLKQEIPKLSFSLIWSSLKSYHGGKNGFYVEKGFYKNVYYYDLISAYSWSMSKLPNFYKGDFYEVKDYEKDYLGIYLVSGNVTSSKYPIFFTHDFKPIQGEFSKIWVTGFEIEQFLKWKEGIFNVEKGFIWNDESKESETPFKSYVEEFYNLKETTSKDSSYYLFYKTLVNALYGKFIQTRKKGNAHIWDVDKEEFLTSNFVVGNLFHPFIASQITGRVRGLIHNYEHRFKAIHTATDSIMTLKKIPKKYLGNNIGDLKLESFGDLLILRNKLYVLYNKKGKILKYAKHGYQGKPEDLIKMFKSKKWSYKIMRMNKLKESFKQGLTPFMFEEKRIELNV